MKKTIFKERLTIVFCVNIKGHFEDPLIVGRASKSRYFKNININLLNETWRVNKNVG